eukprot:TRINITY_DN26068_c0_g1_i1.p1 TRINITY_DN26068_c0_g1~~TRINITY_DN26068_c0_g1_i1.p1  ORF type:complete len:453 (+),score=77.30 TRINITY_DN26068_c0_g1_i1:29-1387(+)
MPCRTGCIITFIVCFLLALATSVGISTHDADSGLATSGGGDGERERAMGQSMEITSDGRFAAKGPLQNFVRRQSGPPDEAAFATSASVGALAHLAALKSAAQAAEESGDPIAAMRLSAAAKSLDVNLLAIQQTPADLPVGCPLETQAPPAFPYEFGWEINIAVPHAYFLFVCGKLERTRSCDQDLSAYYWFSPQHTVEACGPVRGFRNGMTYEGLGVWEYLSNQRLPTWRPVPHKEHYAKMLVTSELSSLVSEKLPSGRVETRLLWRNKGSLGIAILNKQHFGGQQVDGGFISASVLQALLQKLAADCPVTDVMYYRNWAFGRDEENSQAEGSVNSGSLTEEEVLRGHPRLVTFRNISESNPHLQIRETQMRVLSRFSCFIAVHGGNSDLASNFGGQMVLYIRGIDWFDSPATLARLAGISGAHIIPVRSDDQVIAAMSHFTHDQCSSCSLL